jgi:hypothetical protein
MLVQTVEDGSEIGFEMWVSGTRDFARGQGNEKMGEGVRCEAAPGEWDEPCWPQTSPKTQTSNPPKPWNYSP